MNELIGVDCIYRVVPGECYEKLSAGKVNNYVGKKTFNIQHSIFNIPSPGLMLCQSMHRRASISFLLSSKEIAAAKNSAPVAVFAGTKSISKMKS
jgi:hypothetical protein